jgi:hypothetical protein
MSSPDVAGPNRSWSGHDRQASGNAASRAYSFRIGGSTGRALPLIGNPLWRQVLTDAAAVLNFFPGKAPYAGEPAMRARRLLDGASFGLEAMKAIGQAYDAAWKQIEGNFGSEPHVIEEARYRLANAILSVASEDSRTSKAAARSSMARARADWTGSVFWLTSYDGVDSTAQPEAPQFHCARYPAADFPSGGISGQAWYRLRNCSRPAGPSSPCRHFDSGCPGLATPVRRTTRLRHWQATPAGVPIELVHASPFRRGARQPIPSSSWQLADRA